MKRFKVHQIFFSSFELGAGNGQNGPYDDTFHQTYICVHLIYLAGATLSSGSLEKSVFERHEFENHKDEFQFRWLKKHYQDVECLINFFDVQPSKLESLNI